MEIYDPRLIAEAMDSNPAFACRQSEKLPFSRQELLGIQARASFALERDYEDSLADAWTHLRDAAGDLYQMLGSRAAEQTLDWLP